MSAMLPLYQMTDCQVRLLAPMKGIMKVKLLA